MLLAKFYGYQNSAVWSVHTQIGLGLAPTLDSGVNSSVTAFPCTAHGLSATANVPMAMTVGTEDVLIIAVVDANNLTVKRGVNGTTAASHSAGDGLVPETNPHNYGVPSSGYAMAEFDDQFTKDSTVWLPARSGTSSPAQIQDYPCVLFNCNSHTITFKDSYDEAAVLTFAPTARGAACFFFDTITTKWYVKYAYVS
jgi:hypothetical protein